MLKKLNLLFLLFFSLNSYALKTDINLTSYFKDVPGCFLLFDLTKHKLVKSNQSSFCQKRVSPYSTFKIPLSVMAFDDRLIQQETVFKWDGKKRELVASWNRDHTPKTWLQHSVVWVSQQLTPQLGEAKIKKYLAAFNYGNQDFSGGITQAWLGSSLQISAEEQLVFLQNFYQENIPNVSKEAIESTKNNLFVTDLNNGWKLYGKTGSGKVGWFIGWAEKNHQVYLFVLNFESNNFLTGGVKAKQKVIAILKEMKL